MLTITADLRDRREKLKAALDKYVIEKYEASDGYEDEDWKATKVVGHTRSWDVEKLRRIVPLAVLKNITTLVVVPAKIDEYVRSGKIDRKKIAKAYTQKPNKPYVKITRVVDNASAGEEEAAGLAAKLK